MKLLITAILIATAALAQQAPDIYANDGTERYLGKLSANKFDIDSVSNPYGPYGKFSAYSVNNPTGIYGSPFSAYSATNPYTTQARVIVVPKSTFGFPSMPAFPSFGVPKCCSDWSW